MVGSWTEPISLLGVLNNVNVSKRLSILISNDDGIDAPGIKALADELSLDHDVTVIAPDRDRSGMSASISVHHAITYEQIAPNRYKVSGTPADATHLGIRHFMAENPPDLVVSGINRGPNLGNDTIFSGTVGAANCACLDGIPAIAVSMGDFEEPQNYGTAARVVRNLIRDPMLLVILKDRVLNVNVPNLLPTAIKGIREANLGIRIYPRHFDPCQDMPQSALRYGQGDIDSIGDADTDVRSIERDEISLTFLRPYLQDGVTKIGSDSWSVPSLTELFSDA